MNSIQARLSAGLLVSLLGVFLVLWLLVSNSIQQLAENYVASRLQHDMQGLLSKLEFDSEEKLILNEQGIDTIYQRPFSGHYYIIRHGETRLRSRSLWDQTLQIQQVDAGQYLQSRQPGPEQQTLLVVSGHFEKQQQTLYIGVAEDLTPVIRNIEQFKNRFSLLAFSVLAILLVMQIVILRRGLQPLKRIKTELAELEQGKISSLSSPAPLELQPVIAEINHLLSVLHKRLQRSRDALGDLSHAIKKPLTVLHQLQEQLRPSLDEASMTTLTRQLDDMHALTDRILKRARLAGNLHSGTLFNFHSELPALIQTMHMMYPEKSLNISSQLPDHMEPFMDREDMLELLGNLLDNACKWANQQVLISVTRNDQLDIRIEDDGPGGQREFLDTLAARGVRLDESVSGYGFGLAIVADIIDDYGGRIRFDRSDNLGGFRVDVELPVNR